MNAGQAAQGETLPLEVLLWTGPKPQRFGVRTMEEAMAIWIRSKAPAAMLARTGEPGIPPFGACPPVNGIVVTMAAAEVCTAQAKAVPASCAGKRPDGVSFSRRIVEVLLAHPDGVRKQQLVAEVTLLAGRPPTPGILRHSLWRYGKRDPRDPNVWTALPTTEIAPNGRADRAGASPRPYKPRKQRSDQDVPHFEWTDERVEVLTRLAGEGVGAARIAETLDGSLTRNAVISKANRIGVTILRRTRDIDRRPDAA